MSRPFESWSTRARALARPFAENPFRLLEVAPGASRDEIARAAERIASELRKRDVAMHMFATGPATRSAAQVAAAAEELSDPVRAAKHALFVPWLRQLDLDERALPNAVDALARRLDERADPIAVAAHIARQLLPRGKSAPKPSATPPGRLFAGDLDLAQAIGPPQLGTRARASSGFLDALGKAPSSVADAVLAAGRLGRGRRLHASYLRTLLAQVDAGDPAALRRWPQAQPLFDELMGSPGAELVVGWRAFLLGKLGDAKKNLSAAAKSTKFTRRERARAQVLLARIAILRGESADWLALVDSPDANWIRGAAALFQGEVEAARPALDAAWSARELRPRVAPLLAQVLLAHDEIGPAEHILDSQPHTDAVANTFARAWIAHSRGQLDAALGLYRDVAATAPAHLGARWGVAVLSPDFAERAKARRAVVRRADGEVRRDIAALALEDGELEDARRALGQNRSRAPDALHVQLLDRLGQRAQAWKLRGEREEPVRDAARGMLERGEPLAALRHLAGVPLTDPLRRRAAREAVLVALSSAPDSDPDAIAARVLGKVSAEELALLDLPAHLHRAVGEISAGQTKKAIASLRRHLDSGEDARAKRLLDVLTAADDARWPAVAGLLRAVVGDDSGDAMALVDAASRAHDDLWEAAVICAAEQGAAFEVGEFDGGSEALQLAAAVLELRAGLLRGDDVKCAAVLARTASMFPNGSAVLRAAESALAAAQFPQAVERDAEQALRALELAHARSAAHEHDVAVWRHFLAIGSETQLAPERLAAVFEAWSRARQAGALGHPQLPAGAALVEDELLSNLAALLATIRPAAADLSRAALLQLDDDLAREAMARAGWLGSAQRRDA